MSTRRNIHSIRQEDVRVVGPNVVLTLCPLGKPEIAIGHEPRIEPWLPRKSNRLPSFKSRRTLSLLENEPRERNSSPEKNLSNNREPSANSGLDTETKNFSTTGRR